MMQTDPHSGNYHLKIIENPNDKTEPKDFKIILFDFGAVRMISDQFINSYRKITYGALTANHNLVIEGGLGLRVLEPSDTEELKKDYIQICQMFIEPFVNEKAYDFGTSDLPKRVIQSTRSLVQKHGLRAPPREVIFLDRKLAGVYTTLKELGSRVQLRPLLESKISK